LTTQVALRDDSKVKRSRSQIYKRKLLQLEVLGSHINLTTLGLSHTVVSDVMEKNIDSSSKSNPLRRHGKNYDASTWRRMASSSKKMKNIDELWTKIRVIYSQQ